jgi:NitT/TauT family transport system permease protein
MNRYSAGSIVGILLLWELAVRGLEIPKFLLPALGTIVSYVVARSQLLALHSSMTLLEAGTGFILGSLLAVIGAVVGKVFGAYRGLGFLIAHAIYIMDTPRVFASIIACSLLGLSFVGIITLIERRVVSWHISAERR